MLFLVALGALIGGTSGAAEIGLSSRRTSIAGCIAASTFRWNDRRTN